MKKTGKIVLAGVFLLAANIAAWACVLGSCGAAAGPGPGGWRFEASAPQPALKSAREAFPLRFAEKKDEGDQILYQTDQEPGKSYEELQAEEREKEERSWQMLENTVIIPENGRHRPRPQRTP
jgi:hypothetical protein